ncbi:GNAT family N-acetyltransferase [Janibacter cremeus]|uniref:RimJ/RimL family protein N-acetyltransferase n=1 Tax=Janibacter cremeus TaxID=1285192 RepID=A0A852VS88_9MICO|nr:GNAT family N-acetyltransferase [Janibacter cremeus]NYF99136.1 RimJ/RimL family protein N-acetyltransferase [Janibacter cremeus]
MNDDPQHGVPTGSFPEVVPVLTDGPVRLRAMSEEDLPALVEQSNDPDTVEWTSVPQPYDLGSAREFLAAHASGWSDPDGTLHWAIELLPRDGAPGYPFAGIIDLRPRAKGEAWQTGFVLHPAARGRGAMSGALRLAARWAFDHGAPSLYWWAARGNFASWRVAHACGFTHHGTLPSRVHHRDLGSSDAWVASLLPDQAMMPRRAWVEPTLIEAEGLRLRPIRDDDRAVAEPHDHPAHHMPAHGIPSPQTFQDWLLRRREGMSLGRSVNWCIADATSDDPLGEVLVFVRDGSLVEGGTAELGYALRPSARGRGVAGRAARLATEHALRPVAEGGLGLRRLVAETAADNEASNAVLAGVGFTVWGRESAADAPGGSARPALHWERLAAQ